MKDLNKYNVTFVEASKYNEVERTNLVEAVNETSAENLIHKTFGSFKTQDNMFGVQTFAPSDKVKIVKTVEVKEKK